MHPTEGRLLTSDSLVSVGVPLTSLGLSSLLRDSGLVAAFCFAIPPGLFRVAGVLVGYSVRAVRCCPVCQPKAATSSPRRLRLPWVEHDLVRL